MTAFVQRDDPMRLMRRRFLIVLLLILVLAAVRGVWSVYQKEHESRGMRSEAEVQLGELEKRESDLRADIARLGSSRGVEQTLREEYEFAKSGEGVIVVVGDEPPPPPPKPSAFEWFQKTLRWW